MINQTIKKQFSTLHTPICVIGAGSAGLSFIANLVKQRGIRKSEIRIFDPSKYHYYQPGWTNIGGGLQKDPKKYVRLTRDLFSEQIAIEEKQVLKIDPEKQLIHTQYGKVFSYEQLVIASGIQTKFEKIPGLREAIDDPELPVASIYDYNAAQKVWKKAQEFGGGNAIFTEPISPIKCGGAPQKIVFLLEDYWRQKGIRNSCNIEFYKQPAIYFPQPDYAKQIQQFHVEKGTKAQLQTDLIEVRGKDGIAIFEDLVAKKKFEKKFDFLHAVPPQYPPEFIKESGLSDQQGYADVDIETLQHKKYKNIWAIGDSAALPTSKTAAALLSQTPILLQNFISVYRDKSDILEAKYDGYTSCPVYVGGKKLMLAEFKYGVPLVRDETFMKDKQHIPRRIFFHLKKDVFPFVYWNLVPRGLWKGRKGVGTMQF